MEDFNKDMRLIPDYLSKLEKLANPFKGTAFDAMRESQKKIKLFANPFEGSAIGHLIAPKKVAKEYENFDFTSLNKTISEVSKAIENSQFISDKIRNLTGVSTADQELFSGVTSNIFHTRLKSDFNSKLQQKFSFRDYLMGPPVLGDSIFKYLDLYEDYDEDYDEDNAEENDDKDQLRTRIITLDDTIRVQKLIKSVYDDNEEIFKVNPFDFEEMIAELLRYKGFIVHLTKKTRDGGKDIIALHDTNGLGVNKYLVECKRNSPNRPVDVNVVKNLCYTVVQEKANKAIICTTSYFTKDAKRLKEVEKNMLEFKDGVQILAWISEYLKVKVV